MEASPNGRVPPTLRVLVAEDEATVRSALVELLSADDRLEVVAEAADAQEAIELAHVHRPDVALVDVKMPHGGGPRVAREIRSHSPDVKIVALSAYEDRATVFEMLRAGACSYLVKGTDPDDIVATLVRVVDGKGVMSTEIASLVINELVQLLEGSEQLARQLQDVERSRGELVQNLSHELLTPTTVIQGTGQLLAKHSTKLSPKELEEMTRSVAGATTRLRRLVGNVSMTARLDDPNGSMDPELTRAAEIIQGVTAQLPEAESRLRPPPEEEGLDAEILADRELASRALLMLIENALGFSPPEQPVDLQVSAVGPELRIEVLDRGPGVPEEFRDRIFEPFVQVDGSTTRAHDGLGLGLHLVHRIMERHGGRVEHAPREGGGSIFVLVFPGAHPEGAV